MLELIQRIHHPERADATLTLTFDERKKARLKTLADSGEDVALTIERGLILGHGDGLLARDGRMVKVIAANEALIQAETQDPWLFAKVCYHLGNRHTTLEVGQGQVWFEADSVLADLCRDWGLVVTEVTRPFNPESGAYGKHSHSHAH